MAAAGRSRVSPRISSSQPQVEEEGEWICPKQCHPYVNKGSSDDRKVQHAKIRQDIYRNSSHVSVKKISTSIFISNFPNHSTRSDLWKLCDNWGAVIDVYISKRLTKSGKRFGFVRFVKVSDVDCLITNLRTVWIGRNHLFADVSKSNEKLNAIKLNSSHDAANDNNKDNWSHNNMVSFKEALMGGANQPNRKVERMKLVLDSASTHRDDSSVEILGKVKEVNFIPFVRQICALEGFGDIPCRFVGGKWVIFTFSNEEARKNFMACHALCNRFSEFKNWDGSFIPDERLVWLEIVGLPLGACTSSSYMKIADIWGTGMFCAADKDVPTSVGRVCVLLKGIPVISEYIEIEINDVMHSVFVKEFTHWAPTILPPLSDSESNKSDEDVSVRVEDDNSSNSDSICQEEPDIGNGGFGVVSDCDGPTNLEDAIHNDLFNVQKVIDDTLAGKNTEEGSGNNDKNVEDSYVEGNKDKDAGPIRESNVKESFLECDQVAKEANSFQDGAASVVGDKINTSDRPVHHNSSLDDHDIFLLNRLLHQDKCRVRPIKAVASSDLKLADETSSTWLDYVGPLTDELDPEICWSYNDPAGNVQGPFSLAQLHSWKDYFSSNFEIWRYYGSVKETVLLHSALKRRTKNVG